MFWRMVARVKDLRCVSIYTNVWKTICYWNRSSITRGKVWLIRCTALSIRLVQK